jgi:phage nucleotide-binding protein
VIVDFKPIKDTPVYVKALIYGQAGAGKTRFAADAPKPCWFDFESSTETLRHWPEYENTPVKTPRDVEELRKDIINCVKDPEVETVVIDSITTSLDYYLRRRMDSVAAKRDKYTLYEADYKYSTQVFTDLFGFLQEQPINVVIIGHERIFRNNESGIITGVVPDVTPRLQQAVTRLVNVVGYMEVEPSMQKGPTRKLYLNRTKVIEAKNRLNIQDIYVTNPHWKEIFNV